MKKIGNVEINYDFYPGEDLYSDGEIEDILLDIVKNNDEMEYDNIIKKYNNWAVLYHLSHIRQNIIEWMDIKKDEVVLEVGSGCGAITGCLADKAKKVDCIELSEKRSLINANRNKKRDNIEIILGNFETIEKEIKDKYDYITLIGVLEYGALYITGNNPYVNFLKLLKKHLKPNGKIIIAIENKLGMKYWAGCMEDHLGRFFSGIEDYEGVTNVKTFSLNELKEMFETAGYNEYKFYYPYPDYKLPLVIYSDDWLPKTNELSNNNRNFDNDRLELFNERNAFNSIIKENLFPVFSNSFLIVLGNGGVNI